LPAILAFAASCVTNINESNPIVGDGERLVTLALTVPGTPATRALPKNDAWENAVNTVDVLLFDASGNFKYRAIGSTAVDDPAALPTIQKNFTVKLPVCTNYTIVVLANARTALAASTVTVPVATLSSGPDRDDVLDNLVQELANPTNKWTDEFETNGIPMWGYHDGLTIALDVVPSVPVIALTRSVARIDLQVGEDADDVFSLASVYLYNYNRAGSIAPAVTGSGYDVSQWNGNKAIAPHLPALTSLADQVAALKVSGTPLSYSIHTGATVVLGKIENPVHTYNQYIYTFEADAVTAGAQTNTCLVIGGYYNDNPTPTYYRVDFADNNGDCLPLLRNHRYIVTIKEVHAHGYSSKEEAYANKPANIRVEILPWNGGGLGRVVFNDQHYLAVDLDVLGFSLAGGDQHVSVVTDFGSWTIEDKPTWITVSPNTFTGGETVTDITVTADMLASSSRNSEFYIVAGNLRKKIIVAQQEALELAVTPAQLIFYSNGDPLGNGDLHVTSNAAAWDIDATGNIQWLPAQSPENITGSTVTTHTFRPVAQPVGGGTELASVIDITASDGTQTITRHVTVIQLPVSKGFFTVMNNPYPAVGGNNQDFIVVSAYPWEITHGDNSAGAITLTPGANAAGSGLYKFNLTPWTSYLPRELHLVAELDGGAAREAITVMQSGTPISLDITNPSGGTLVLDAGDKTVSLSTNATAWKYTVVGDETLDDLVEMVSITPDLLQSGSSGPLATVTPSITFKPVDDAATTTLKAGTLFERTLVFTTEVNAPGVTEVSTTLALKRTIPVRLEYVGPTSLPVGGGTVEFTVNTNAKWWVKYDTEQVTSGEIPAFTGDALSLTNIPANGGATRNLTIMFGVDGDDTPLFTRTLSQPGTMTGKLYVRYAFYTACKQGCTTGLTHGPCPNGETLGTMAYGVRTVYANGTISMITGVNSVTWDETGGYAKFTFTNFTTNLEGVIVGIQTNVIVDYGHLNYFNSDYGVRVSGNWQPCVYP
jgi:hypothetical protein